MTANRKVYVGIAGSETSEFPISLPAGMANPPDLSTVTAVRVELTLPGGQTYATWTAAIISQTATTLLARRVHANDGSDVALPGLYKFCLRLTMADGTYRRTSPDSFEASVHPGAP